MMDHKEAGLTPDDLKAMYRSMLLGRKLDERMWLLNRAGKLPFVISCQGQEATQIGAAYALESGDITSPYYRDLALVTHMGMTPEETMLSAFAKSGDVSSGGKQMPSHFSKKSCGILTQGSCVATQVLHAVGAALAFKMDGEKKIALTTLGEGSSNQGDFHEGLNFAGVHDLPFICIIENNKYAISVPHTLQYGADKLSDRAIGYGMHGEHIDGNDPIAVYKAVKEARERAVNGDGATLIEAMSTRLTAHSSDDDDSYRTLDERNSNKELDCNIRFKAYILEHGAADEAWFEELDKELTTIVNDATKKAEQAPYPAPEEALLHVYGG
ncbi:thiamine pyrophosphate-dependent dehydrogenase E1 component subunit alpha [Macrococcus equipercicus]|uniref:2-oxoisovalerate dehydrogenase subunit alpha n=1 Tax=Macrococcus equipercicus TaxID=69967 RepID=A0A9Q9F119_9STAP|nr:thiamine pyrophosphate-dependent dehydrogenase E1 component subunit alpha [Macrococcus equipercicus]KAA1040141.1 thiamine pyrophosphate-dependent dehydrogenase E1 component subunit alpha [Macrococcus equipercicus]UTH12911.1 thiamine pyrophosphate-dependent dehydrogenase E1 component subunit alpha [Macrococcus equipercicus]